MRPPRRQNDSANQERIGKAYAAMSGGAHQPTAPHAGGQSMQAHQQEEENELAQLADLLAQANSLVQKLQEGEKAENAEEQAEEHTDGQPDTGSPSAAGMP